MTNPNEIPAAFKSASAEPLAPVPFHLPNTVPSENTEDAVLKEVPFEPGDIEAFLKSNLLLFYYTEKAWRDVDDDTEAVRKTAKGLYPEEDPFTNTVVFRYATPDMSRGARKAIDQDNEQYLPVSTLLEAYRQDLTADKLERCVDSVEGFYSKSLTENIVTLALDSWEIQHTRTQELGAAQDPDTVFPEQVNQATDALYKSYGHAHMLQELAIRRVDRLLGNDTNVMPFVERIREIIDLRKGGINEFPGLLEVVGVMVSQQQAWHGASSLEKAIMRVTPETHTIQDFMKRMLDEDTSAFEGQCPKDFLANVEGAKMAVRAIAGKFGQSGVDQEAAVSALVEHLESSPNGLWQEAYNIDSQSRTRKTWREISNAISTYSRKGRQRVGQKSATPETAPAPRSKQNRRKQKPKRERNPQKSMLLTPSELQDITLPSDNQAQVVPTLAVMKGFGGSERRFIAEPIEGEIMEHDLITKFLRKHGNASGLDVALRSSVDHLIKYPADPFTTKRLEVNSFYLVGDEFSTNRRYPLRRFRPNSQIADLGAGDLNARLRIIYGLAPGRGRSFLLLKTVELREGDTYRSIAR